MESGLTLQVFSFILYQVAKRRKSVFINNDTMLAIIFLQIQILENDGKRDKMNDDQRRVYIDTAQVHEAYMVALVNSHAYLHACLLYVQRSFMTNTTLRDRFGVTAKNSATASRIIKETLQAGKIRP